MNRTIYHWVKQEVKALCIFSHIMNVGKIEGDLERKGRYLRDQSNKVMDMIKVCSIYVWKRQNKTHNISITTILIIRLIIPLWGYIIRTLPEHKHVSKALPLNSIKFMSIIEHMNFVTAQEMIQLMKCSLHKCQEQGIMMVHTCNHNTWEDRQGDKRFTANIGYIARLTTNCNCSRGI